MTVEEKRDAIRKYCENHACGERGNCQLYRYVSDRGTGCYSRVTSEQIEANYTYLFGKTPDMAKDSINHPDHYQGGKYECIEVMRAVFGDEAVKTFCLLNAFKYIWRCGKKHDTPYADIAKALWYLDKHKNLEEGAGEDGKQDDAVAEGA